MKLHLSARLAFFAFACLPSALWAQPPGQVQGLTFRIYDIGLPMSQIHPLVPGQSPNIDELRSVIDYPAQGGFSYFTNRFLVEARGSIETPVAGAWGFRLTCDDGARLSIDGATVVDHDGLHTISSRDGSANLAAGLHPFSLWHFDDLGPEALRLEWQAPGTTTWELIPPTAYWTEGGVTRVTSPGPKLLFRGGGTLRPGRGMPLAGVHPSYQLTTIRPPGFEPEVGGLELLPGGRLAVLTFKRFQAAGEVVLIENPAGPVQGLNLVPIASGLLDPLGLCWHDGSLWVAQRHEVTQLIDADGNGSIDDYRSVGEGWKSENFHHYTFGLVARNNRLYTALSAGVGTSPVHGIAASPSSWLRGAVIEIDPTTGKVQPVSGGLRAPNGLGLGPGGDVWVTDNQGSWLPASKLVLVQPGRFFGHHNDARGVPTPFDDGRAETPPEVWIPHGEVSKSPSQPCYLPGGPFAGQMVVADVAYGGLKRVFLEQVGGGWQGAVLRFSQGFEAGLNRVVAAADGTLYVGGIGGPQGWAWNGTRVGLQRLAPNGTTTFEIKAVRALADGFELEFTAPVALPAQNPEALFQANQWTYAPTPAYGGVKQAFETLTVRRAQATHGGMRVRLAIDGLITPRVVHLIADVTSTTGQIPWTPEAWYTLNRQP